MRSDAPPFACGGDCRRSCGGGGVFADASEHAGGRTEGRTDGHGNFIYTRRDNVLMMACFFAYKVCKRKEAENIYEIAAELASECRKKLEN